ncbi:g035 [Yersinia phage phiR1-37]|uniref:hypothetical protein n=1 Tax=Yersinia phage phiR1-37 TaxID=331278 RepID=UPI00022DBCCF|nr:hypothetical protein phiR1-37_gp035 [Yersinia phage phiR1-37]CCE26059.1 g035 [Yersinia phage phiR1-37]
MKIFRTDSKISKCDSRRTDLLNRIFKKYTLNSLCNNYEKHLLAFDFNDFSRTSMFVESRIYADVNTMVFYRYYGYLHEKD